MRTQLWMLLLAAGLGGCASSPGATTVEGVVRDGASRPVAGARVVLALPMQPGGTAAAAVAEARTDSAGRYSVTLRHGAAAERQPLTFSVSAPYYAEYRATLAPVDSAVRRRDLRLIGAPPPPR